MVAVFACPNTNSPEQPPEGWASREADPSSELFRLVASTSRSAPRRLTHACPYPEFITPYFCKTSSVKMRCETGCGGAAGVKIELSKTERRANRRFRERFPKILAGILAWA